MGGKLTFHEVKHLTEEHYQLLLEADPARKMIEAYACRSVCIAVEREGLLAGLMLFLPTRPETVEIVNIVVVSQVRNQGIGQGLIQYARKWAKKQGYSVIEIGTGSTSFGQLYLYQKNGFRISGVDTDFFVKHYNQPIFENNLHLKDMIRLRLDL